MAQGAFETQRAQEKAKVIPLWNKRAEILRARGTTPRNLYEGDPFHITGYEPGSIAKKHVRLLWMSDPIAERKPILPGFRADIFEPVTEAVAKELGIQPNTKERTIDGVYKVGRDAFLVWAPEVIAKEMDDILLRGARAAEAMVAVKEKFISQIPGEHQGAIGDGAVFAQTPEAFETYREEQLREMGTPLVEPPKAQGGANG